MSDKNQNMVSVIIPVHNWAKANNCLEALKKQTYSNIEIITIACKGFPAEKRNYGFNKSKGKYVYFLDEDEYPTPTTVEDCVRKAEEGFSVIAVPMIKKPPISYMSKCVAVTRPNTPKMMFFKREVIEKIGGFKPEYIFCDDVEILERVLERGFNIGEVKTCHLLHDEETGLKGVLFKTLWARKSFERIAYVCQKPAIVEITGKWTAPINRKRILRQLLEERFYGFGVLIVLGSCALVRRIP
jgi:glycosyltransferase involved in cell wall biosynthesis